MDPSFGKNSNNSQKDKKDKSQHSINVKHDRKVDNISFNTNIISFYFKEGQQYLLSEELHIGNHTQSKLYFDISGIESKFCDILPNSDIIDTNATVNIKFMLKIDPVLHLAKKDQKNEVQTLLRRFLKEKTLKIKWGQITEDEIRFNKTPLMPNQQQLTTELVLNSNIFLKEQLSPQFRISDNEKSLKSMKLQQNRSKQFSKEMSMMNIADKSRLSSKKAQVSKRQSFQSQQSYENVGSSSWLSFNLVVIVALLSFIVGFAFG